MALIPISDLPATTEVTGDDYLAIDDGTSTKKIKIDDYNASANTTAQGWAEAAAALPAGTV